jgi:hypothetical protein
VDVAVRPSDHVAAGECPFCHGSGRRPRATIQIADADTADRLGLCPLCYGTARWPPPAEQQLDWMDLDDDKVPRPVSDTRPLEEWKQ